MNVNYAKFPKSLIVEQFQGNYLKSFLMKKHYFKVVSRSFPVGKAPVGFNLKPNVACKKSVPASLNIVDHVWSKHEHDGMKYDHVQLS